MDHYYTRQETYAGRERIDDYALKRLLDDLEPLGDDCPQFRIETPHHFK